jgi:hypothetical protein
LAQLDAPATALEIVSLCHPPIVAHLNTKAAVPWCRVSRDMGSWSWCEVRNIFFELAVRKKAQSFT